MESARTHPRRTKTSPHLSRYEGNFPQIDGYHDPRNGASVKIEVTDDFFCLFDQIGGGGGA